MHLITEAEAGRLVNPTLAFNAVKAAFIAVADGSAVLNPLTRGTGFQPGTGFTIKSGQVRGVNVVGAKLGSYWSGNEKLGLPCHNSTILLLDPKTGEVAYVIEARGLNGWRTAAADAVAASVLARKNSRVLSLIGAGHQAYYEARAICEILEIEEVWVSSRTEASARALVDKLRPHLAAKLFACSIEAACRAADILVTATPALEPLFDGQWIKPGTHIAAMGTDRKGKQEIPVSLMRRAVLFADHPPQSREIGEFQHIASEIDAGTTAVTAIGDVLTGRAQGRMNDEQITIFDSSGIAIQDLLVAQSIIEAASRSAAS
jgi:ornithine cyclodeaminase